MWSSLKVRSISYWGAWSIDLHTVWQRISVSPTHHHTDYMLSSTIYSGYFEQTLLANLNKSAQNSDGFQAQLSGENDKYISDKYINCSAGWICEDCLGLNVLSTLHRNKKNMSFKMKGIVIIPDKIKSFTDCSKKGTLFDVIDIWLLLRQYQRYIIQVISCPGNPLLLRTLNK